MGEYVLSAYDNKHLEAQDKYLTNGNSKFLW